MLPDPLAAAAPATPARLSWMDGLRGLAIVCIIVLHGTEMLKSIGMASTGALEVFNSAAAPFRVPLLMTLSGMLLGGSLAKGAGRYVTGKLRAIAWPYAVWLAILLAVFPGLGLDTAVRGVWAPNTYLWYLHTLLLAYLVALALRRVPAWASAAGALALALIVSALPLPDAVAVVKPERTLLMLCYFFAGSVLMQHLTTALPLLRRPLPILGGLASAACIIGLAAQPDQHVANNALFALPLLASLWVGIALLSRLPWRDPVARALRWVGKHSIVYYVTHWIAMYWTLQLVAEPLVPRGVEAVLAAMVLGALLAATGLAWLVQLRTPVRWLFRV